MDARYQAWTIGEGSEDQISGGNLFVFLAHQGYFLITVVSKVVGVEIRKRNV